MRSGIKPQENEMFLQEEALKICDKAKLHRSAGHDEPWISLLAFGKPEILTQKSPGSSPAVLVNDYLASSLESSPSGKVD